MNTLDFLWLALALGFAVLVAFLSYVSYQLGLTLKSLRLAIDETRKVIQNFESLGSSFRLGFLGIATWFLGKLKKGGEKHE